jgi:hypothetical protein
MQARHGQMVETLGRRRRASVTYGAWSHGFVHAMRPSPASTLRPAPVHMSGRRRKSSRYRARDVSRERYCGGGVTAQPNSTISQVLR